MRKRFPPLLVSPTSFFNFGELEIRHHFSPAEFSEVAKDIIGGPRESYRPYR